MIFFITGESGSGKTTLMREVSVRFKQKGVAAGGFLAPGRWEQGRRSGFSLFNLLTQEEFPLASVDSIGGLQQGPFRFDADVLHKGVQLLIDQANDQSVDILFVDEVGPLELRGGGWAPALKLLAASQKPQVWSVRPAIIKAVANHWNVDPVFVFPVREHTPDATETHITQFCQWLKR